MPIVPDTKNWTWVLERTCPECGFDSAATSFDSVPARAVESAHRIAAAARAPRGAERRDEFTWSPVEYAAHVRDVCRIFAYRIPLAARAAPIAARPGFLGVEEFAADGTPVFADWDQDATAVADRYDLQDPAEVVAGLERGVSAVAGVVAALPVEARGRRARRGDGSEFTVDSLVRYFLHDLVHHVHDVEERPVVL